MTRRTHGHIMSTPEIHMPGDSRFATEREIRTIRDFSETEILRCRVYVPLMEPDLCFENCAVLVVNLGGEMVDGWRFLVHPWGNTKGFLSVSAHTVWRAPDGTLYDPTPYLIPTEGMPFVADPLSFVTGQKVVPLSKNKELRCWCREHQAAINRLAVNHHVKLGSASFAAEMKQFALRDAAGCLLK